MEVVAEGVAGAGGAGAAGMGGVGPEEVSGVGAGGVTVAWEVGDWSSGSLVHLVSRFLFSVAKT
jgi:hypothetical protein